MAVTCSQHFVFGHCRVAFLVWNLDLLGQGCISATPHSLGTSSWVEVHTLLGWMLSEAKHVLHCMQANLGTRRGTLCKSSVCTASCACSLPRSFSTSSSPLCCLTQLCASTSTCSARCASPDALFTVFCIHICAPEHTTDGCWLHSLWSACLLLARVSNP